MRDRTKKTLITIGIIVVAGLLLSLIVLTTLRNGGASAHYDKECLTQPLHKPLTDCKE